MNDKDRLKQVSKAHLCPVCGKGDANCSRGGRLVLCRKHQGPHPHFEYKGQSKKDSQWAIYLYLKADAQSKFGPHGTNSHPIDWQARAEQCLKALTAEARYQLAEHLGLPEAVLVGHSIGYLAGDPNGPCWTFPERDGAGQIIGINRRYPNGSKKAMSSGQRGLFLPAQWDQRDGPIFCPEGPSDALALTALGLAAVGRPSNVGGVEHLAALLQGLSKDRTIIIVGEYDPKSDGSWPGKDGAILVSRQLAEKLGRPVSWVLPPKGHKDVRAWVLAQNPDPTLADAWQELGEQLLAQWEGKYQNVGPELVNGSNLTKKHAPVELPALLPSPPAQPTPAAFHGLAGQLVQQIEPHSEADPVALLVQILVAFGNCIGRTAHFTVEGDTHYLNLFAVLVGLSSKGRKGSSWGQVNKFYTTLDSDWAQYHVKTGLASGEGLIWAVRDPIWKTEAVMKNNKKEYEEVQVDAGVEDKRLLCYEPEFASLLKVMDRQGNTLSPLLRQFWDGIEVIQTLTKNSPAKATAAHLSMIGHVTAEELRRYLSATEQANGFGNRFLWLVVQRSKKLPEGGQLDEHALDALRTAFLEAVTFARTQGAIGFDDEGRAAWHAAYEQLSEGKPGLAGCMLARAEAQVRRLACLYALLDLSSVVRAVHLQAALALWKYVEETVRYVFGNSLGDPVADEILLALQASSEGLTRDNIRQHFKRHRSSHEISQALGLLLSLKLAHGQKNPTEGRSEERWFVGPEPAL
jgi:hypothetical protein